MSRQTSLNVSLTPTLQNYVRAKVRSGRYESASEVVRESLRALQARERTAAGFWANVRDRVLVAREQVAQGQVHDGETAMDEILAEIDRDAPPARKQGGRKKVGKKSK
jgi:antitoxin ParD1/3/4